jgi:malate permease and related proteins
MAIVYKTLNLQIVLFILMVVGIIAKRVGILTKEIRTGLSDLLIYVILPCNIVHSFMGDISITPEFLKNCILALVISTLIQIFVTFANKLFFRRFPESRKSCMSYGMICCNSGFIGLPVAEELYGDIGVLYTSLYQIPIRFTMWTAGLALFTNTDKKSAYKKLATHPCIIAVFVGFAIILLPFDMPSIITDSITTLSKCTTALSMLVIGSILSDADFKTMFSKDVLYFSFLRLLGLPLLVWVVLMPFHLDSMLVNVGVIMSALPAGSTTSILADKYGGDSLFASQITFVTTLFSVATIPMLAMLLG